MKLEEFLESLTENERDFIAALDYGEEAGIHRRELDVVISRGGRVDFEQQFWHPYEVIELGKNVMEEGHEREFAACLGIVLHNAHTGDDGGIDLEALSARFAQYAPRFPSDVREMFRILLQDGARR